MTKIACTLLVVALLAGGAPVIWAAEEKEPSGSEARVEGARSRQEERHEEEKSEGAARETPGRTESKKDDGSGGEPGRRSGLLERLQTLRERLSQQPRPSAGRRDTDVFVDRDRNGVNDRKGGQPAPGGQSGRRPGRDDDYFIDRDGDGISDDRQRQSARPEPERRPESERPSEPARKPAKKSGGGGGKKSE